MNASDYVICLTAVDTKKNAKYLADFLINEKLSACINIVDSNSIYIWKKKVTNTKEFLLLIKTKEKYIDVLRRVIKKIHNYEMPEVIFIPLIAGDKRYLKWIENSLK